MSKVCSCAQTQCLKESCRCFKERAPCSENCTCNGCKNTEDNMTELQTLYLKPETVAKPAKRCRCKVFPCLKNCSCFALGAGCTSKCKCVNCGNPYGIRGATNIEPAAGQGSDNEVGATNIPHKAVQSSDSNKRPRTSSSTGK